MADNKIDAAKMIGNIVLVVLGVAVLSFLLAYPVKWTVNYLFTPAVLISLFGGPLSVGKAWILSFVCHTLFKTAQTSSKA
jgi:hypothetical protein